MFAPAHHPAMRHVGPTRVELGTRTIFNLLGPLSNPAGVKRQMVGVFAPEWIEPVAETLKALGTERAWVAHGDGYDEITTTGETQVAELADGKVRVFTLTPEAVGLKRYRKEDLRGGDAAFNAAALRAAARRRGRRLSRHGADERRRRAGGGRQGARPSRTASRGRQGDRQRPAAQVPRPARRHFERVSTWPTSCGRSRPTSATRSPRPRRACRLPRSRRRRATPTRRAASSRRSKRKRKAGDFALIAEIKKASPSQGADPRRFRSAGAGARL